MLTPTNGISQKGQKMKIYTEQVYTRAGCEWVYVTVSVNVPTPKEIQAMTKGETHYVVISNFGGVFSVALFKNGDLSPVYGKTVSNLSRQDAIGNAAEWLVSPY